MLTRDIDIACCLRINATTLTPGLTRLMVVDRSTFCNVERERVAKVPHPLSRVAPTPRFPLELQAFLPGITNPLGMRGLQFHRDTSLGGTCTIEFCASRGSPPRTGGRPDDRLLASRAVDKRRGLCRNDRASKAQVDTS